MTLSSLYGSLFLGGFYEQSQEQSLMFFATFNRLPTVVDHPRKEDGKMDERQISHSPSSEHVVLLKNLIWEC